MLYLAGWGRSGSTLAESLLDRVPGLVGVGEIKFLWERGLLQNRRRRHDPDAPGGEEMPRMHPGSTALYWSAWNVATERIALGRGLPYLRFRYEDLVAEPTGTLRAITELAGVPGARLPDGDAGEVMVPRTHQVSGNPMRFRSGPVALRLDDEWTTGMATRHRYLTGAVTVPLRHRYGYKDG